MQDRGTEGQQGYGKSHKKLVDPLCLWTPQVTVLYSGCWHVRWGTRTTFPVPGVHPSVKSRPDVSFSALGDLGTTCCEVLQLSSGRSVGPSLGRAERTCK